MSSMTDVYDFEADTPLPKEMPPRYLVAGVVHRSVTVFYGQQDTGKSTLALSVGVAVASGRAWLGRPVESAGPVSVVSGDPDGKYEYAERLDKVRDDLRPGKVRLITPAIPAEPEAWEEIRAEASASRLVIIDNLHQFVPGSLNDDDRVKLVYQELDRLRRKAGAAESAFKCQHERHASNWGGLAALQAVIAAEGFSAATAALPQGTWQASTSQRWLRSRRWQGWTPIPGIEKQWSSWPRSRPAAMTPPTSRNAHTWSGRSLSD